MTSNKIQTLYMGGGIKQEPIFPPRPSDQEIIEYLEQDAEFAITREPEFSNAFWKISKYLSHYKTREDRETVLFHNSPDFWNHMCFYDLLIAEAIKTDGLLIS